MFLLNVNELHCVICQKIEFLKINSYHSKTHAQHLYSTENKAPISTIFTFLTSYSFILRQTFPYQKDEGSFARQENIVSHYSLPHCLFSLYPHSSLSLSFSLSPSLSGAIALFFVLAAPSYLRATRDYVLADATLRSKLRVKRRIANDCKFLESVPNKSIFRTKPLCSHNHVTIYMSKVLTDMETSKIAKILTLTLCSL